MEVNNDIKGRLQRTQNNENSVGALRNNAGFSWRPTSFVTIANNIWNGNPVLDTIPVKRRKQVATVSDFAGTEETSEAKLTRKESGVATTPTFKNKTGKNTIVSIVLVEAKGLPDVAGDGLSHGIYCKIRLGSHTYKSKSVTTTRQPQWRQRFKLNGNDDQLLQLSVWDKGKQKNFMGSCVIDLSDREIDRTHDIWLQLDEGYGSVHLSITICTIRNLDLPATCQVNTEDMRSKYAFYNINTDLDVVGQLHVKVIGARGLYGRPSAYCTLELDNEKIQTPKASPSSEPAWNKNYVFNIYDVTSALEVKVYDSSFNCLLKDFLGRVSIPLLRTTDGETRWYALKDNNKRKIAKGNCPRVRLEISIAWNPVTASLKLFRPKQVKYTAKQPKFDIPLIYKNIKFIRDIFAFLAILNEHYKRLFEWDDRELSYTTLFVWLIFWYFFEPWVIPLLVLGLFPIFYIFDQSHNWDISRCYSADEAIEVENTKDLQNGETMTHMIKGLPELTISITNSIDYLVSLVERLYNLATFKVPFLTYLSIVLLAGLSGILYCIPFKYLMMALGLYKYLRKRIHPDRVLNNDLLDFISRVPDNKILKDWNELRVPEPLMERASTSLPSTPMTPSAS